MKDICVHRTGEQYAALSSHSQATLSKAVRNRMSAAVNIAKALMSNGATSNGRTFNCTFAYSKSKLLAIGMNNYRRVMSGYMPKFKTTFKAYGEDSYVPCLHGEINCLLKLGLEDCSGLDFFSVRIDKHGHCTHSRPCANCERILRMTGFKHVYFFDRSMDVCELDAMR